MGEIHKVEVSEEKKAEAKKRPGALQAVNQRNKELSVL